MDGREPLEGSLDYWREVCADPTTPRLYVYDSDTYNGHRRHWLYWAESDRVYGPYARADIAHLVTKRLLWARTQRARKARREAQQAERAVWQQTYRTPKEERDL